MGTSNGPQHFITRGAQKLADLAKVKSGGTVTVRVFPAGQLGGEREMAEALKVGTLDLAVVSAGVLANFDPLVGIYELPFLFDTYERAFKGQDGPVADEVRKRLLATSNMRLLGFFDNGFRYIFTRSKPIRMVADLQGVKIRVPEAPSYIRTFEAIGASPTVVPFPDLYTALQTGLVEGYEGNPASNLDLKFFEVTRFISPTKHLFLSAAVLISETRFAALSAAQQKAVLDAWTEALAFERSIGSQVEDAKALTVLTTDKRLVLQDIDNAPMRAAAKPVLEWYAGRLGPDGMDWIAKLTASK
jgi:tripartite ATP-independent transporter DctP family solute receptor